MLVNCLCWILLSCSCDRVERQNDCVLVRVGVGRGCGRVREGGEGDKERHSEAVQGDNGGVDSATADAELYERGGAAGAKGMSGGRDLSSAEPGGTLLARVPDTDNHHVPGAGKRQRAGGTCKQGTMPSGQLGPPRDSDGHTPLPGPVPRMEFYPGAAKGDCYGNTCGNQEAREGTEDTTCRGENVRVRVQMAEADDDMDEPWEALDATQPDATLRAMPGQHEARDEDRQEGQQRQEACCAAGGVHTRGLAKQDRPAAGTGLGGSYAGEADGGAHTRGVKHGPPSGTKWYNRGRDNRQTEKRSKIEGEEKKGETGAKPLNIHARNAWRRGDQGIRASGPRRDEIKRAKGMARRIKQNQHWAEVCAGMAMAQVYIEPITLETGAAVEGPADRREPFKLFGPLPGGGAGWGAGGGRRAAAAKTKKKKPSKAKKKEKKKETDR